MRYGAGDVVAGKFELLRECGGGGFGTVFKALDLIEDREVALKFLNHGGSVEEVRREFLPLRRLDHPNVVRGLEVGQTPGGPWFIVTEFVDGQALQDRIEKEGPLDLTTLRLVGTQLLDALSVMHPDECRINELRERGSRGSLDQDGFALLQELEASGLVHRDIKPLNLMLRPDGRVVLVDFGISSRAGTRARTMKGTPSFWPPDLAVGALDRWDPDVDRYAAGATLFIAACGVHPADGVDRLTEIVDPAACRPDLPDEVSEFLTSACWPKRSGRFATTAELVAAWNELEWTAAATLTSVGAALPFSPWQVREVTPLDRLGDEDVRQLIVEIIAAEGPMLCSRLYNLVEEASGTRPTSRLNRLVYRMVSQWNGRLSQVEALGNGQQNKTVYAVGTDPYMFRTLGDRAVYELPNVELAVHLAHARQALGIADEDEGDYREVAAQVAATLGPERRRTEREDLGASVLRRIRPMHS
jgi:serine/threonine protein kinase